MDILSEIVKVVVLAVSSLGGIGLIKFLFFLNPERRMKNIEADEKELNVMKSLVGSLQKRIEQQDEKIKELNDRLDKLYAEKHEQERENYALRRENNELKFALKEAEHNICVRPDDECFKGRLPKRTYYRLKKPAAGDYDAFYEDNKETDNKDENEDS
jgi:peptidoglycan hydrolase CwlO-like protein